MKGGSEKGNKIPKKFKAKLEETERDLRNLKNNLDILRKEENQLQQQLEEERKKGFKLIGHEIEIKEEIPVHNLVKDLTNKLNKQRLLITRLQQEKSELQSKKKEELKN